ncbi:MAG: hypothetical protein KatS3mg057_2330 [Herpetosiphonaceae bacterium]|nr:MAG: hypothetical protein KatS3mg057_2330 [Herpetosiphonaceae bacterium]
MTLDSSLSPSLVTRVLLVRLGDEWFALPATYVREVVRWREPTPVPGSPPALLGVLNLRGMILALIDLRFLLNVQPSPPARSTRLVTVESAEYNAALLVDEVRDLLDLDSAEREAPPAGSSRFIAGLLPTELGRAGLLDLAAIFEAIRGS